MGGKAGKEMREEPHVQGIRWHHLAVILVLIGAAVFIGKNSKHVSGLFSIDHWLSLDPAGQLVHVLVAGLITAGLLYFILDNLKTRN